MAIIQEGGKTRKVKDKKSESKKQSDAVYKETINKNKNGKTQNAQDPEQVKTIKVLGTKIKVPFKFIDVLKQLLQSDKDLAKYYVDSIKEDGYDSIKDEIDSQFFSDSSASKSYSDRLSDLNDTTSKYTDKDKVVKMAWRNWLKESGYTNKDLDYIEPDTRSNTPEAPSKDQLRALEEKEKAGKALTPDDEEWEKRKASQKAKEKADEDLPESTFDTLKRMAQDKAEGWENGVKAKGPSDVVRDKFDTLALNLKGDSNERGTLVLPLEDLSQDSSIVAVDNYKRDNTRFIENRGIINGLVKMASNRQAFEDYVNNPKATDFIDLGSDVTFNNWQRTLLAEADKLSQENRALEARNPFKNVVSLGAHAIDYDSLKSKAIDLAKENAAARKENTEINKRDRQEKYENSVRNLGPDADILGGLDELPAVVRALVKAGKQNRRHNEITKDYSDELASRKKDFYNNAPDIALQDLISSGHYDEYINHLLNQSSYMRNLSPKDFQAAVKEHITNELLREDIPPYKRKPVSKKSDKDEESSDSTVGSLTQEELDKAVDEWNEKHNSYDQLDYENIETPELPPSPEDSDDNWQGVLNKHNLKNNWAKKQSELLNNQQSLEEKENRWSVSDNAIDRLVNGNNLTDNDFEALQWFNDNRGMEYPEGSVQKFLIDTFNQRANRNKREGDIADRAEDIKDMREKARSLKDQAKEQDNISKFSLAKGNDRERKVSPVIDLGNNEFFTKVSGLGSPYGMYLKPNKENTGYAGYVAGPRLSQSDMANAKESDYDSLADMYRDLYIPYDNRDQIAFFPYRSTNANKEDKDKVLGYDIDDSNSNVAQELDRALGSWVETSPTANPETFKKFKNYAKLINLAKREPFLREINGMPLAEFLLRMNVKPDASGNIFNKALEIINKYNAPGSGNYIMTAYDPSAGTYKVYRDEAAFRKAKNSAWSDAIVNGKDDPVWDENKIFTPERISEELAKAKEYASQNKVQDLKNNPNNIKVGNKTYVTGKGDDYSWHTVRTERGKYGVQEVQQKKDRKTGEIFERRKDQRLNWGEGPKIDKNIMENVMRNLENYGIKPSSITADTDLDSLQKQLMSIGENKAFKTHNNIALDDADEPLGELRTKKRLKAGEIFSPDSIKTDIAYLKLWQDDLKKNAAANAKNQSAETLSGEKKPDLPKNLTEYFAKKFPDKNKKVTTVTPSQKEASDNKAQNTAEIIRLKRQAQGLKKQLKGITTGADGNVNPAEVLSNNDVKQQLSDIEAKIKDLSAGATTINKQVKEANTEAKKDKDFKDARSLANNAINNVRRFGNISGRF